MAEQEGFPGNGGAPSARRIVIDFRSDGTPAVSCTDGIGPTQFAAAAFWLEQLARLQAAQQLAPQLRAAAPRLVVPQ